ncbi:hypothetical protein [Bacillus cereus]|uniref:hypothetical protein n=1 Tax=Bacillus cereus TaxID=1396 RepID=UPI000BF6E891|nr:hypothetical protein [Bacillus cereus]PFB64324.1 hypothetical protein CN291_16600 [Bacillus cereus]
MINHLEAGYYRDTLRYYSYVKTQTHINKFVEYPKDIVEPTYISLGEQMSFCNYIPEVLEGLTSSTCLDYPNEDFGRCIGNIQGNVQDHCPIEVSGIFHFGLLLDNLHLFTEAEETELKVRIDDMFHNLGDVCMSFKEFYETYFASQFFGGYSARYTQFEKHMEYTYILWCDFEFHTTEEFGPRFMGAYSKFAEEYYEFYKELVDEIQRRKQVDAC